MHVERRRGTSLDVRAFAKINFTLRVLGLRPDGYHELRTTYQSVALCDRLSIAMRRGPFEIRCDDPRCPTDRNNLVWRAAENMWRSAGRRGAPRDVAVTIVKRIPIEAGLGGGSSDAAAALRAFRILWRVDLDTAGLCDMAARLGADVPFFIEGGTALGVERGDLLFPLLDPVPSWVVLVAPAFGVSTRDAYGWWDRMAQASLRRAPGMRSEYGNDLERVVVARHPEIGELVRGLRRLGASHASMSGSGSAVFGLFKARSAAERVARTLGRGARRTIVTRTLDRRQYRRLAAPRVRAR